MWELGGTSTLLGSGIDTGYEAKTTFGVYVIVEATDANIKYGNSDS